MNNMKMQISVTFVKKKSKINKKQFTCLGENTEKYITFTVPIEK